MNLKRQIFLVNLYSFCIHTIFVLAIIIPYYQNQIGLSFHEFMIGEAVFAGVIIAMEVPSGWMSDVWSRKGTLIVGTLFAIVGYTTMLHADNLPTAILGQAITGVGVAFNSGTITSILYDSLAMKGKEHLYQRLEGKRHGIGLYAIAIASVIGGILYQIDPYLPLKLDVATLFVALGGIFFIVEPDRIKKEAEHHPIKDMLMTMKYALYGHKEIAGIIIVSTVLFCSTKLYMWTQQPYMQFVEIPTSWFGYIIAGGFLFGGLMGQFGHKIQLNISNRHMLMMLTAIPVLATIGAIILPFQSSIIFILMVSGVWGFGFPFVQNAINKHADPARRATILSSLGLLISIMFIPSGLILGWLEENISIQAGLSYIAIQLGVLSIIGFWLWNRGSKKSS